MYAFRITCCALIFILRLRFPPGISIATILKRSCYILSAKVQIVIVTKCDWTKEYHVPVRKTPCSIIIIFIIKTIFIHACPLSIADFQGGA